MSEAVIAQTFATLLPDAAHWSYSRERPANTEPAGTAEQTACAKMHPRRSSEYLHGRYCARLALVAAGFKAQEIPTGLQREPIWPAGVVGSITHCAGHAAAVVAGDKDFAGIGIDLEESEPLGSRLMPEICMPDELARYAGDDRAGEMAKITFSAKESIYKCVWPELRVFFGFQDVGIELDRSAQTFRVDHTDPKLPADVFADLVGRYAMLDGLVITAAYRISS